MCENRHSLRVGAGFVIDSGRHGHARGSCRTYGRKERAHRSLQNHRTVLHKLPHASSSCPIRRPKHQNLSGCWVATHRFCGGGLNANFFAVLQEYSISQTLVDANLVFLGVPADVGKTFGPFEHPGTGRFFTLGGLIRAIADPGNVRRLSEQRGVSPAAEIRRLWAGNLSWLAHTGGRTDAGEREVIRKVLEHVRPFAGWVAADSQGVYRWAYEVLEDHEAALLGFLFDLPPDFVPESSAEEIVTSMTRVREEARKGIIAERWKVTLPTSGVHADLSLGICSGAEDYFEAQRYFDLELKRLEVERLKLELKRAQIRNEAIEEGQPTVRVSGATASTAVNIGVSSSEHPVSVAVDE